MEKFGRYFIFYALLATALTLFLGTFNKKEVIANVPDSPHLEKQLSENIEGWKHNYTVIQDTDNNYLVSSDYKMTNTEIRNAAKSLNYAAAKLAKSGQPFQATLVFTQPLSPDEFKAFAKNTGIKPTVSYIWGRDANDGPIEAAIPSVEIGGVFEPLDLHRITDMQTRQNNPIKVEGITSSEVSLDAATFQKVSADARVFTFDVISNFIERKVKDTYPEAKSGKIQLSRSLFYFTMRINKFVP